MSLTRPVSLEKQVAPDGATAPSLVLEPPSFTIVPDLATDEELAADPAGTVALLRQVEAHIDSAAGRPHRATWPVAALIGLVLGLAAGTAIGGAIQANQSMTPVTPMFSTPSRAVAPDETSASSVAPVTVETTTTLATPVAPVAEAPAPPAPTTLAPRTTTTRVPRTTVPPTPPTTAPADRSLLQDVVAGTPPTIR